MQQSNYSWKQEEQAPVVVQVAAQPVREAPVQPTPAAKELFALEAPRAAAKIEQPAIPTLPAAGYTNNYKQPPASQAGGAAQPASTGYTKYAATSPELIPVPVTPAATPQQKFWNQ